MIEQRHCIGTLSYLGSPFVVMDPFAFQFAQLVSFTQHHVCKPTQYVHLARSITTDRSLSRNELARTFVGDWLLMLDADQLFEPDLVQRMLHLFNSADLDVLSGIYVKKSPPYQPLIEWRESPTAGFKVISSWSKRARLIQISRAGAGCLLVRRRVFKRILSELGEDPFAPKDGFGEDFSFFGRCERLNIACYAAAQVHLEHLTMSSVSLNDWRPDPAFNWHQGPVPPTALVAAS